MFAHPHAALWIDHKEARLFHVDREQSDERRVLAPVHRVHRHPKTEPQERDDEATRFFADVTRALADSAEILLVGPSTAKLQFLHWLHDHERALAERIVAVETVDHPTSGELVAYARRYFRIAEPRVRSAERT